ncbi:MAG: LytTR family DNA-binding domain-containing protein [Pseudomonadota bacterium]
MRILIVDDEQPARDRLRQLVGDFGEHDVVGEAGNGEQAIALADQHQPDVVLLDIRMPGVDGIETAHHLNSMDMPPAVVFTTAYDEYAIEAFEAQAIGYVLKPVRRERLQNALRQAARLSAPALEELSGDSTLNTRRQHVCTRVKGELQLIAIDDVWCFVADQKYVTVHHAGGNSLIDESLKSLEAVFAKQLVRIHRGALVAVDQIDRLQKGDDGAVRVELRESTREPVDLVVSRRHVADVKRRLKEA